MSARLALLRDYVAVIWNDARYDELPRFAQPDMALHSSGGHGTARGLAEVAAAAERSRAPFAEYVVTIEETVGSGAVLAWRWSVRAKMLSGLLLSPDLRTLAGELDDLLWVSFTGMAFTRFRRGLIAEERVESDPLPLLRQLGMAVL